ncbi:proliferation marker protein Ki-67 isoform X2 [Hippopotamus amphibius kiboko]|uniref:proliferation marker protein Ki-67 isoform X2 n=1 Tax=Hippopotamus amphibius kiboko TaxID=575201 RepID=UPI0025995ACA|nr:proliferation marker protein Ki-67 isoform X2 [Hippopotamus amphibius kiboko]
MRRQQRAAGAQETGPEEASPADTLSLDFQPLELYENEGHQNGSKSPEFPGQRREQETSRRVSRSSLSSNPDGKVQDSSAHSKLTEEAVSGRPVVHGKDVTGAGTGSGGSEDHVSRKTPGGVHPAQLPRDTCRNATAPTAGDFKDDSSVTLGSSSRELKAYSSIQCLKGSGQNESPFRKLYESMKVELDVKSGKDNVLQNHRRSGSQSHCTAGKESTGGLEGKALVSLKSRPRSGRGPQSKADPASGEQGSSQMEGKRSDELVQTPKETKSPSILGTKMEMPKTTTPARYSQQSPSRRRRSEDLSVVSDSASPILGQSEGSRAENKTLTPRKFLPRNQSPIKVESLGNTPEKLFSRKRKSIPTNVDNLTTETQILHQTISAPLVLQVERKIQNDFLNKPEKLGVAAGQTCPGSPGLISADVSGFGDSTNKMDGVSLKRRRVSFGGRLRPELFDENLPPNTPLKRGETPKQRRSLAAHTPAVLKKVIKEQPQPSGKEDASEIRLEVTAQNASMSSPAPGAARASPAAPDQGRRLSKVSSVPSGSKSPHQTDIPKRGGRKSGNLPSKRASLDRSQHGILQMIYSRRRSGASEANLVVAKSWADVVKLGAKQTQTKAVKRGPPRQLSKRQKRIHTPKKPTGIVHNQFSTGHANSPCTIVIGKAHIERVTGPARPCRVLNSFMVNRPVDFSEDLSGLPEMFKTPGKGKPQRMSMCPPTFSNADDLVGKELPGPHVGEEPLLCALESSGQNVFPGPQDAAKELSDQSSASPALRRPPIKIHENIMKTPRNVCKTTGAEMKTPGSAAATPKAASSANKFRRSAELRSPQTPGVEGKNEDTKPDALENVLGRRLRKTPQPEQKLQGDMKESERSLETCKKNIESKENSGKMTAVRRSRRASELKCEPAADLTALKRSQETEPEEDQTDILSLPLTPADAEEAVDAENKAAQMRYTSPHPGAVGTPTRTSSQLNTASRKVDVEDLLALEKPTQTPGGTMPTHREPGDDKKIRLFKETAKQKLDPAENVAGSKKRPRTPKGKAPPHEDLAGFKELFQTPHHNEELMTDDKPPKILCQSPQSEPVNTPSRKGRLKTPSQKVDVHEDVSALRKPQQTPRETRRSLREPEVGDRGTAVPQEAPGEKVGPAENVTGSKRRPRTPKDKVPPLEDLAGVKELFQTPDHAKEPRAVVKTPKMLCTSSQPELVLTPTNTKRQLKTPLEKADVKEELSALGKPTQVPGETRQSGGEPVDGDKSIRLFKETPKQKLDPAENVNGSKKRPRTPKRKTPLLEDLAGFRELFQTPHQAKEPMPDDESPQILCQSPQPEPVNTPSRKGRLKTPSQKVDVHEDVSALRKPQQTPGETRCSLREPEDGDRGIAVSQEAPGKKVGPTENVTGSKRRPRTSKDKVPPLEDLLGFRELFQTPNHTVEPRTDDKPTTIPCKSPPAEAVNTPTSRKRQLQTPLWKVDVEEELSAFRTPTQMPGETRQSEEEPSGGDKSIKLATETPKQKLDSAENVTGSKRRPRTPKDKVPRLEDLAGVKELFQTPDHAKEPRAVVNAPKMLCTSSQPELVLTPTNTKRQLKTPLGKADVKKELSALGKPTQMPGKTRQSGGEPVDGDKSIRLFKETPKQKLDSAENVTGRKRLPRTPKDKVPLLEDLAGVKELFQTPDHAKQPMTDDKTPQIPCKSPPAEAVNTPTSKNRWLKTPPLKVDVKEELLAFRRPTQTPGETRHSEGEPADGDEDVKVFKETSRQKLDPAEDVPGIKRRPRTPKEKAQPLEDMVGFKELFRTPDHTKEPMTDDKPTTIPCESPPAEPVNTPTSRKRRLKSPPQKVDTVEDLLACRKSTQTPGRTRHSGEPAYGEDKAFKKMPKRKLDSAENLTGNSKWPRTTLKEKAQPLEDLAGFKELFQTPNQAKGLMTEGRTPKMLCQSPQPEPVVTSTSITRCLKTPSQKVAVQEDLSALRKLTQIPGETMHSDREPEGDDRGIAMSQEASEEKLDRAEKASGSKRRPRTPKEKAPPLEDLVGFKELFQTPDRAKQPMADEKTTTIPYKSPPAEPVTRRTGRQRQLKSPPGKAGVEEPPAPRKPTKTPRETRHSHKEAAGDENHSKVLKENSRQKCNPAENARGVKSRLRTVKEKTQPMEDPASFKEHFQKPDQAKEPVSDVIITPVPQQSPPAEPVTRRTGRQRRLKSPPGKVGIEEPSAPRKPTKTPRETRYSHKEAAGDENHSKVLKENSRQKCNPAENALGVKSRLRTVKEKTQPVEDPASFKELSQKPDQAKEPVSDVTVAPMPQQSPPAEPVTRRTGRQRRLKSPPEKVGVEEPSAPRKPTQTPGDMHREPVCDEKDNKAFKENSRQKLSLAENVLCVKSRLRTVKGKTQPVEDPASVKELSQRPDQAKEPVSDVTVAPMPHQSPPAEPVTRRTGRQRRLKSPPGKVGVEEPSAPRKPIQAAGETTHREPVGGENSIKVFKETSRQNLSSEENVIGVKSRLRTCKEKAQPLEDPARFKELFQKPDLAKGLGNDAAGVKRAPKQTADRRRPVETSQRSLRTPKGRLTEDIVGSGVPVKSSGESRVSPSPERKPGADGRVAGRKRPRPMTAAQDPEDEKPLQKKQRTAPRERREPPEPLGVKKRSLRVLAQRTEPGGNLCNDDMKTKATDAQGEDTHAPDKGISLGSKRPTKTGVEEQKPEVLISAEKMKMKRSEKKSTETSQEMKLQSPEAEAKNPTSGGRVQERRTGLRSGRQNQTPLPEAAEAPARERRVEIPAKKQEEEKATEHADLKGLRSRRITVRPRGSPAERESEQRVTRSSKRCANNLQKENDDVGVKKIRTRSRRDNEED